MRPIAAFLALAVTSIPPPVRAFRQASVGTLMPDRTMPTLDGKRAPLLVDGKVNVFVFFRLNHDHSESALRQLGTLEHELAGRPVRFVAIVSDCEPPAEVARFAREVGLHMPVLVDQGDAFYGELGVAMYPSAGIVGRDHRLSGFQAFRKINYRDAMRGRVQFALGDIDEPALAKVIDPGVSEAPSGGRAHARVKLARTLLAAGQLDAAITNARAGLALDPGYAEGHQVLADALARQGRCDEAKAEAGVAHQLAPATPVAVVACARR